MRFLVTCSHPTIWRHPVEVLFWEEDAEVLFDDVSGKWYSPTSFPKMKSWGSGVDLVQQMCGIDHGERAFVDTSFIRREQ